MLALHYTTETESHKLLVTFYAPIPVRIGDAGQGRWRVLHTHFLRITISKYNFFDITVTTSSIAFKLTNRLSNIPRSSIVTASAFKNSIVTPLTLSATLRARTSARPVLPKVGLEPTTLRFGISENDKSHTLYRLSYPGKVCLFELQIDGSEMGKGGT
ncbi:hypothetical protein KCU62_g298, partial [Aureobasidium sp. EXF-3399]